MANMDYDLAREITELLEEIQIVTNEHDANSVMDALMEEDFENLRG